MSAAFPHRNANSVHSHRTAVYTGPARKFDRSEIERQVRIAAQGEFDALVMLALDHPGPRAKVLAIVAEVLIQLGLVPANGRARDAGRRRQRRAKPAPKPRKGRR